MRSGLKGTGANALVMNLLRERASGFVRRPSAEELADSLTVENYPDPRTPNLRAGLVAFRHLRQDARVAAAKRALGHDTNPPQAKERE